MRTVEVNTQNGFTIVEILVALGLGLFLSAALINVFTNTQRISNVEMSLSRVQETGRFALETITNDIRMAGHQGCADPNDAGNITIIATELTGADYAGGELRGFEVGSTGAFTPALIAGDVLESVQDTTNGSAIAARPGSDVIFVQYAGSASGELESDSIGTDIEIDANPMGLADDDYAVIANCRSAHLFEVTGVTAGTGGNPDRIAHADSDNTVATFLPAYTAGARVMKFENRTYFVGDTGRDSDTGQDVYALYVRQFDNPAEELLEGVESLQIMYGQQVGGTGGAVRYVTADDASLDMSEVFSVKIGILVQSFEQVAAEADTRTYTLPGATISNSGVGAHAGDQSLRKVFTATVALRNKRRQ